MEEQRNPECRSDNLSNDSQKCQGKWTKQEHQLFLQALNLYGNQWEDISQHVKTRDPSQVRSHAQKFNNKLSNDKEKIGYQPIKVRDQNEIAITRSRTVLPSNNEKEEDFQQNKEKNKPIKKENAKSTKKYSKNNSNKKKVVDQDSEQFPKQSFYVPTVIRNYESSQTQHSEILQRSFFMDQVSFPKLIRSPQSSFSVFALINGEKFEPIEAEVTGDKWFQQKVI